VASVINVKKLFITPSFGHGSTDSIPQDALQSKENTLQLDIEEVWQGRENIAESWKINELWCAERSTPASTPVYGKECPRFESRAGLN